MSQKLIVFLSLVMLIVGGAFSTSMAQTKIFYLDELDLSTMNQDWGYPQKNLSVDKNPLSVAGKVYSRGVGTHANSLYLLELNGNGERFSAMVGVDDEVKDRGTVEFILLGDDTELYRSGVMRGGDPAKKVEADLSGVNKFFLQVSQTDDNINYDHADWLEAKIRMKKGNPKIGRIVSMEPYILTPKPGKEPRINGAKIFGVRPGTPFLFTVPATGERPMTFSAENLPAGLQIDAETGRITGTIQSREFQTYHITLKAKNKFGEAKRDFRIVVGEKIALTPPMGWNSWNCWGPTVSQEKVVSSARAMAKKGLINHGWTYINIDDGWQGIRGGKYNAIMGNRKFPDIKKMISEIHALGLKVGIYSTPWRGTYAGHIGGSCDNPDGTYGWIKSGEHNEDMRHKERKNIRNDYTFGKYSFLWGDVQQWAEWGFDYLKYDWNPIDVQNVGIMSSLLRTCGRDIVFSLSNSAVFENAPFYARLANAWRTTGDITDSWGSMAGIGFNQHRWTPYAGHGHWNDPDMLVVGKVGWSDNLHPTRLSPDEQYTHISLWCLLSAPLLLGCDLAQLDDFTLNLLTNDEVIEVNQDPLGDQAVQVNSDENFPVYARKMEDGSLAVGLFNRDFRGKKEVTAKWEDLKISGKWKVRDLWRQKDLGVFEGKFSGEVPVHGVVLVRMFPKQD
ncbi:MAG: alpha-galactosidase [Calditrichaeota bacterium]|nr:alpha-galactosidase [Calditrichota bacterium]